MAKGKKIPEITERTTITATVLRRKVGSIMNAALAPHQLPQKTESQIDH